jgi:hypothetical protein
MDLDSEVATIAAPTTGTKDVIRHPGRATGLLHKMDLDSEVAIIAEPTTGIKDVVRRPGRATGLPHKVDLDSEVATIAEIGQETVDNAEDATNDSTKRSPVWFRPRGRTYRDRDFDLA